MQGLICMSHSELTRLEILQRIEDRRLNQTQAATMLGMTPRQEHGPAPVLCDGRYQRGRYNAWRSLMIRPTRP